MPFQLTLGQTRFTKVNVLDEPADGGAYHQYEVCPVDSDSRRFALINFQKGPVKEAGVNGIFMEDLLHICEHRLECFQAGAWACEENAEALKKIQEALMWLNKRTTGRQVRGVEGTSEK
jgi:hypothetical protein